MQNNDCYDVQIVHWHNVEIWILISISFTRKRGKSRISRAHIPSSSVRSIPSHNPLHEAAVLIYVSVVSTLELAVGTHSLSRAAARPPPSRDLTYLRDPFTQAGLKLQKMRGWFGLQWLVTYWDGGRLP